MGRPCLLTPEVAARVCDGIRGGLSRSLAARAAGVSPRSVYHWLKRGRGRHAPAAFRRFAEDLAEAETDLVEKCLITINGAVTTDWRAALATLERRFPFGPRTPIDLSRRLSRDIREIIDRIEQPARPPQRERA